MKKDRNMTCKLNFIALLNALDYTFHAIHENYYDYFQWQARAP